MTFTGFDGEVVCPDFYTMCTKSVSCSDIFDCVKKKATKVKEDYDYEVSQSSILILDGNSTNSGPHSNSSGRISMSKMLYLFFIIISYFLFVR